MDNDNFRKLLNILQHVDRLPTLIPHVDLVTFKRVSVDHETTEVGGSDVGTPWRRHMGSFDHTPDFDANLVENLTPELLASLFDRLVNVLEESIPAQLDRLQVDVAKLKRSEWTLRCKIEADAESLEHDYEERLQLRDELSIALKEKEAAMLIAKDLHERLREFRADDFQVERLTARVKELERQIMVYRTRIIQGDGSISLELYEPDLPSDEISEDNDEGGSTRDGGSRRKNEEGFPRRPRKKRAVLSLAKSDRVHIVGDEAREDGFTLRRELKETEAVIKLAEAEKQVEVLMKELEEKETQFESLKGEHSERNATLLELNESYQRKESECANLQQQAAETANLYTVTVAELDTKSNLVNSLKAEVREKDKQLCDLKRRESAGSIAYSGTAYSRNSFIDKEWETRERELRAQYEERLRSHKRSSTMKTNNVEQPSKEWAEALRKMQLDHEAELRKKDRDWNTKMNKQRDNFLSRIHDAHLQLIQKENELESHLKNQQATEAEIPPIKLPSRHRYPVNANPFKMTIPGAATSIRIPEKFLKDEVIFHVAYPSQTVLVTPNAVGGPKVSPIEVST